MPIVYVTTNRINGRKYLGKCVHKKPSYLGSGIAIRHAIKLYGRDNFTKEIIYESNSLDDVSNMERKLSMEWNVVDDVSWYNMKPGGTGGSLKGQRRSEETKRKISESKKGQQAWNKGLAGTDIVKHREETKRKIGLSNMGISRPSGADHVASKTAIFTDPSGTEHIICGIRKFCRDNNINPSVILRKLMLNDHSPIRSGWKVRYEK